MDMDADAQPKAKRRKLDGQDPPVTISSARDLHHLLASQQNSSPGAKTAIQQFKQFLSDLNGIQNDEHRARKFQILKDYSKEQLSSNSHTPSFPDLISTWSSAVEANNDSLLSLLPSVLALFLNIISSRLEFRDIGLSLCKCLLLKEQLRLLDRGLTATKTKEHLISPCLRLLTEIVSYDGGEVADLLYSKRDTTFRRLEVFLGQRTPSTDGDQDARQRPDLRCIAQRYLLANLKFQSASVKGDIIVQKKIMRSCLQDLKYDRADTIYEILTVLENEIVRASSLTKAIKTRLFTVSNLSSLANLFSFPESAKEVSSTRSIRKQVDTLLRLVCTQQESGVILPQTGWYPVGNNPDKTLAPAIDPTRIDLGTNSRLTYHPGQKFAVKNGVLSAFIHGLRPELDTLQASLLLEIFRAAPELVADYFSKKTNFIAEPKDTPSWLGQSAFFFSVIQLPVPAYCGWSKDTYAALPPPPSAVIESILPRSLDRANSTRCLNLNHEVITLFAVRAVTVAFQKLVKVIEVYHDATSNVEMWKQASSELVLAFSQRCPLPKDVLSTLQRTPKSDQQLRGSIIELLAKYYQVIPQLVLLEKFDTSLALVDAIGRLRNDVEGQTLKSSRFSELENLIKIAQMSPDTRWWQKPESWEYSAFTSMLKAVLEADQSIPALPSIKRLLGRIGTEHGIVLKNPAYFDALTVSFTPESEWMLSARTLSFFDNCAYRIAKQPTHYQDLAVAESGTDAAVCLLPFAVVEQWIFVIENEKIDDQKDIGEWITRFLALLVCAGEKPDMIHMLHGKLLDATQDESVRRGLKEAYGRRLRDRVAQPRPEGSEGLVQIVDQFGLSSSSGNPIPRFTLEIAFELQPKCMETMEGLERLDHEDLESVVVNGRLGRLCRSLSSTVEETRRQGFTTLRGMMKQIELSSYSEKGTLLILIGELVETAISVGLTSPLASILTEFAAEAVEILKQPYLPMYGKVNKFLQKGPSWNLSRFIGYWAEKVLLRAPEDDNGSRHETCWLLNLLVRGLQRDSDMELYRKSNVFDRVLALYASVLCTETERRQILELVYNSIKLGGGMTLITRMGIENWFAIQTASEKDEEIVKEIGNQLQEHIDVVAAQQWRSPVALSIDGS